MPQPSSKSYIGIAKEVTQGTPVAATDFIPVRTIQLTPHLQLLDDKGLRGAMADAYNLVSGVTWSEVDLGGDVFTDTIGYVLGGLLGDVTTVAGAVFGDVSTTTTSAVITSATANFVAADVGKTITGTGIPAATTIASVQTPTQATMSAAATATATNVAVTIGRTGINNHSMGLKNSGNGQPTPFTIDDQYVANNRQIPGAVFHELGLKFMADGLLQYTAKAAAWASVSAGLPAQSFSTVVPQPAWACIASIGGASSALVQSADITIKRTEAKPIFTLQGTQNPFRIWVGSLDVAGKMVLVMEDDTQLTNYLTNAQPALDFTFQPLAQAAIQNQLKLHMSQPAYTMAKPMQSGKSWVELEVDFRAIANTADVGASGLYSPIKATVQSAKASGTYQ
ncbi:MAG: phage tail tube protein [Acidimicrobiales bacterium]